MPLFLLHDEFSQLLVGWITPWHIGVTIFQVKDFKILKMPFPGRTAIIPNRPFKSDFIQ